MAILNGSNPLFFNQPLEPVIDYPENLLRPNSKMFPNENDNIIRNIDSDLAIAWRVMRRFCLLVNLGTQTQRLMPSEMICDTMVAVTYRLLYMSFTTSSIDETLRLGLLAFSYHVFLQWQDIKLPYHQFPFTYRNNILGLKSNGVSSELMLWLLMVGANSVFKISDEAWLRESLRERTNKCEVKTWKEMEKILKTFMWILFLDEQSGKEIFDSIHLDNGNAETNDCRILIDVDP